MKVEELIDLVENNHNKMELVHLLNAISDWPCSIDSVYEYFLNVKSFLEIKTISIELINKKMLKIDMLSYVWELESISELILFLEVYKSDYLKILI
jgi:hypothetical protein